jgi:hypothetical protein
MSKSNFHMPKGGHELRNQNCPLCNSPEKFTVEEVAIFQACIAQEQSVSQIVGEPKKGGVDGR